LIVDQSVLDATSRWGANCTTPIKNIKINITGIIGTALGHMNLKCPQIAMILNKMNNTIVREIRGANINPKSSFKNWGAQNTRWRKLREQIR